MKAIRVAILACSLLLTGCGLLPQPQFERPDPDAVLAVLDERLAEQAEQGAVANTIIFDSDGLFIIKDSKWGPQRFQLEPVPDDPEDADSEFATADLPRLPLDQWNLAQVSADIRQLAARCNHPGFEITSQLVGDGVLLSKLYCASQWQSGLSAVLVNDHEVTDISAFGLEEWESLHHEVMVLSSTGELYSLRIQVDHFGMNPQLSLQLPELATYPGCWPEYRRDLAPRRIDLDCRKVTSDRPVLDWAQLSGAELDAAYRDAMADAQARAVEDGLEAELVLDEIGIFIGDRGPTLYVDLVTSDPLTRTVTGYGRLTR